MSRASVESQYLVGSASALRPLDQKPFFRSRLCAPFVAMRRANP